MKPSVHLVGAYLRPTENWIYRRLRGLRNYPPQVYTFDIQNRERYPLETIEVLGPYPLWQRCFNRLTFWPLASLNAYGRHLRRSDPAIVHSHFAQVAVALEPLRRYARRRLDCPTVCSFYGYDLMGLAGAGKTPAMRRLLRDESAFIVEGPHMAQRIVDAGADPRKLHVNRLGLDLALFPRRHYETDPDRFRVMIVGRFIEKKGIEDAIRAAMIAKKAGIPISLTVIGDGPLAGAIRDCIRVEGAESTVNLLGSVTYEVLIENYYCHDLLLQPSVTGTDGDTEGGAPVSLSEAMAAGLPVVASTHADIPNVVNDGVTGLLAPERRPDLLAEHLVTLARDTNLRRRFSDAARLRAESEFDSTRNSMDLEKIYDSVANGKSGV